MGKIPWRKSWQPTPAFLPREPHGQRNLAGYSPWGHRVGHDWSDLACMHAARQKPKSSLQPKGEFIGSKGGIYWHKRVPGQCLLQVHLDPGAWTNTSSLSLYRYAHVYTFICVTTHFSNILSFVLAPFLARLSPLRAVRWWPAVSFLHRSGVRHSLPGSGESRTEAHRGTPVDSVTQASGLPTWS